MQKFIILRLEFLVFYFINYMRTTQENLELFKKYFAPYEIVSYNVWKSFKNKDEIYELFDDKIIAHMVYLRVDCFKKPFTVNNWYQYIEQLENGKTIKQLEKELKIDIYEFRGYREPECLEGAKFSAHRPDPITKKSKAFDYDVVGYSSAEVRHLIENRFVKDLPYPIRIEDKVNWNHNDVRVGNNTSRKINYFTV